MKRLIFSILLTGTVFPAMSQSAFSEIHDHPALAAGKYYAYQAPDVRLTPAPEGYEPFYISAFARHGSRYLTKKKKYDADDAYICGSYRQRTRNCTMHFIKTSVLWELILTAIREVSDYVRQDEQAFIDKVQQTSTVQIAETQREQKRRLAEATERNGELNTLIKKLYEGNATGKIPDKHFERLLAEYDREQTALETEIEDLQEQIDSFNEDSTKADKFIAVVRRYTDFTELTTPMLNEFIEKVVVHEATGGRTDRKQKIDVYFNFVGQVELPPPDRA